MQPDAARQRALEALIAELTAEAETLKAKLGDLHGTDVVSLRRAYKSLAQHVQALDVESRHLPALVEAASEAAVTPEFVARQTQVAATVAALVYGVGRLLAALRVKDAGPLTGALALVGAGIVGLRLAAATLGRLGATAARRRRAMETLRADVGAVVERVKVMAELAESGLRLHRMHPSQQFALQSGPPDPQPRQQQQQWQAAPPPPPPPPQQQPQQWSQPQWQPLPPDGKGLYAAPPPPPPPPRVEEYDDWAPAGTGGR